MTAYPRLLAAAFLFVLGAGCGRQPPPPGGTAPGAPLHGIGPGGGDVSVVAWHGAIRRGEAGGVPYQWGSNVLAYNTKVFPKPPDSWKVVFEEMTLPDGRSSKGRVQAFDGPIYVADAALYLMSHSPELEIADPYALDRRQFEAA